VRALTITRYAAGTALEVSSTIVSKAGTALRAVANAPSRTRCTFCSPPTRRFVQPRPALAERTFTSAVFKAMLLAPWTHP
jgi:hypothetical protein